MTTDDVIQIERSPDFTTIAHEVSAHMSALPLTNEQNNRLVELVIKQINEAETTAFRQGFDMGVELGRYFAENPEDAPPVVGLLQ